MLNKTKALVVFSGGLDSILVVKTLQAQNIDVTALCFESNFYNADKARETVKQLGVELKVVDLRDKMLALSKNPPNGYGKNMNPCVDCHGMMFRLAGEYMKKEGFDILATGEVLGQRPFSQNKDSLKRVEVLAEVEILRPLSAQLLPETIYEKESLVNRELLHRVQGRTREGQMELIAKYKITQYPSPGGGCLLTDPEFSARFSDLLNAWPACDDNDVELLKNGRIQWVSDDAGKKILLIIGRDQAENDKLEALARKGDIMLQLKDINGPTTLVRGLSLSINQVLTVSIPEKPVLIERGIDQAEILRQVAKLTGYYAVKARGRELSVNIIIIN